MFNYLKIGHFIFACILLLSTNAFAEIPSIYINTNSREIGDDYIPAEFQLKEQNQITATGIAGIRWRGAFSRTLPKKSYRLEFWADTSGTLTQNFSLLGMRSDDDWNLNAMYNEPLRINTAVSNELWLRMHSENSHLTGDAKNGISTEYVQLYINGTYEGLYILTERIDRKQLNLDTQSGELYKTFDHSDAALFKSAHPYDNQNFIWDGIEWRYPDDIIDWSNLHHFVNFVTTSGNTDFYLHYKEYLVPDNIIDYYIFLNLLALHDNTGKNIFIGKQNQRSQYFYAPWDLDGSFGFFWDGNFSDSFQSILSNGLYDRLIKDCYGDGFVEHLKIRWEFLRSEIIDTSTIYSLFDKQQQKLLSNNIYQLESARWNEYKYNPGLFARAKRWVANRINFLDEYFANLCTGTTDISEYYTRNQVFIYPNPTRNHVNIKLQTDNTQESIVEIYQLNGQKILTQSFYKDIRISTENFAKGMHIIRILNEDVSFTEKILVQ